MFELFDYKFFENNEEMATPRSEAWNYFKKHETEENKAVCQVEVEAEDGTKKICGRILGVERSCTSALFNHLNRLHSIYPKKIQMPGESRFNEKDFVLMSNMPLINYLQIKATTKRNPRKLLRDIDQGQELMKMTAITAKS